MPRARTRPSPAVLYGSILAMVWFWSLNYVVSKFALREFPALLLGGLRAALAGTLILPVYLWHSASQPDEKPGWTRRDVPQLVALGLVGVALNQLFFILGMARTSVAHAAILAGLTPIMVLLIAASLGMERITRGKVAGMAVSLAGVAAIQAVRSPAHGATLLGDFLIVLGGAAFAIFTVAGKRTTGRHGGLTVSTFAYVAGAVALLPVTLWQSAGFDYSRVSASAWASLLYMAAFSSIVSYLIFYYALTHIPASRVSAFSYLQPLLATLMAVPLLGEHVTAGLLAGGALVFAGVFVTERS